MENINLKEVNTDDTQTNQDTDVKATTDKQVDRVEPKETAKETAKEEKTVSKEDTIKTRLKQLSSEFKLNLFDREGVIALADTLKEYQSKANDLQAQVEALTKENTELKQAQEVASARYKALAFGFTEDNMAEAFALMEVNKPEGETIEQGLARVKETYGVLFNQKATQVGLLHNDTQRQQEEKKMTEAERYMAKNPKYQSYYKNKR